MTQTDLEKLRDLVDLEAIRALKYRYAALCDQNYPSQQLAALFTAQATWDGGIFGRHEGRAAIEAFFSGSARSVEYAVHYITNPEIEVRGDHATGTWLLWQAMVLRKGGGAYWLMARYHDTYERLSEGWKFSSVQLAISSFTPYEDGPGKTRIAAIG